jgi:amino acid adenylation domain-containing protein
MIEPSQELAGRQRPGEALSFYPLSTAQRRIWLLEQIEPGGAAFHVTELLRLDGPLQTPALERALNRVVSRHETLRTTFEVVEGEAAQVVHPPARLRVPVVDLSPLADAEREAAVAARLRAEADRPFDLSRGPLLRATLLRLGDTEHLLALVMHHLVSDGWSLGVLLGEWARLYGEETGGAPAALPPLPVQYAEYAEWQRRQLEEGGELGRQLDYWRRRLSGAPPLLELPADRPRPPTRSTRAGRLVKVIREPLAGRVRALGAQARASLFMTLLAAFKTLLARLAGVEDVVVGTPAAGRNRAEVEGLIGFFVNTLALRTDLSGGPSFTELLGRVREAFLDAYEHQDVPFEKLVEELAPARSLAHAPLVQVSFNMLNFSGPPAPGFPGLTVKRLTPPETGAKYDLTLYAQDEPIGITLTLVYSADLFEEPRMVGLLAQFESLLEQVVAEPGRSVGQHSLIAGARKVLPDPTAELTAEWRGPAHALLAEQARLTPDRTALADATQTWAYRELDERSDRLAARLIAAGVQRRDAVAIYAHRSAPLVWAVFGVLKAGAAFVILDPAYPAQRLADYLRAASPSAWLHVAAAGEPPPAVEEALAGMPLALRLKLHPHGADEELAGQTVPPAEVRPGDLAYVAFTSGSTGKPKGVLGTHGSLTHYPRWVGETFGVGETDRFSMLSGLSHDPLLRDIFTPLQLGAALCIPDPELFGRPGRLAEWMRDEQITVANLTPAMARLLGELPAQLAGLELTRLRRAFFVGDVLTRRDVADFKRLAPSAACVNLYGATETQRALAFHVVAEGAGAGADEAAAAKEVLPVGRGIEGVQLLVLNGARQQAGVGEAGEIYFRSPHLAKGYLDDPELTRARFLLNPFTKAAGDRLYRTGDLGRYLPDGQVSVNGRADTQVKVRGFRVELGEVEAALRCDAGILDCAAVLREDDGGERRLVAYLVTREGFGAGDAELREHLRERLPDYMIPSAFVPLEAMPVTPNGKVDRSALPAPDETRGRDRYVPPQTPVEEALAQIWCQALNVAGAGRDDNFFALGGHSLLTMRVLARVREVLQVELPLRSLFEAPTLGAFAARVEAAMRGEAERPAPPIERRAHGDDPPLSFAQEGWLLREWWEEVHAVRRRPFHLASAFRLSGPLDLGLLEQALAEMCRRHDVLRSTFPKTKGLLGRRLLYPVFRTIFGLRAVHNRLHKLNYKAASNPRAPKFTGARRLVIRPRMAPPLAVVEEGREAEIARLLAEQANAPFDYGGPLLRLMAIKAGDDDHVVGLVMHHMICDAWSMRLFVGELLATYQALAEGRPPGLPEPPLQYADFARWQREWFKGEALQAAASYWERQFEGVGLFPELTLPFTRTGPLGVGFHHEVEVRSLPLGPELCRSLRELAARRGVTLYTLLLAALDALLHRRTGRPKISLFTPFANRGRVETQGLLGWLSNVHVLTTDCAGNPPFAELLARTREVVLGAYAHQEVPYLLLVKTLLPRRTDYEMPQKLFEVPYVLFDYVVLPRRAQQLGALSVSPHPAPPGSADAGLEVKALEDAERLTVSIRYSPARFAASDIAGLLAEFGGLLDAVVADPERRILDLPAA